MRAAVACALFCFAILLGVFSIVSFAVGPAPMSGTLSVANPHLTYTDPVGPVPNGTGEGVGFSSPVCAANGVDCSIYTLTLDPSVFILSGPYDPAQHIILIQLSWSPSANSYAVFVEDKNGNVVGSNTSGFDPTTVAIAVTTAGLNTNGPYTIVTTLEQGSAGTGYTANVTLAPFSPPGNVGGTPPRYQMYEFPGSQSSNSGLEPSIGVDWNPNVASLKQITPGNASVGPTRLNAGGITMFTETFDQFRVSFDDCSSPAINTWTNTAFIAQQTTTLDAIGFTDHFTSGALGTGPYNPGAGPAPNFTTPGRTFHGQLTAGDSNTSYTDDDGANHTQTQGGGIPQGPDHETIGAGPYNPNSTPPPPPHPTYPNAVYYCTQNVAPEAECSRSDDGGLTFGPGIPIYQNVQQCTGSIHGHVKVARDGTVYVPNYSCSIAGAQQGVAVSTDNGLTWTERNIPGSGAPKPGLVDPSVAVALNDVGKPAGQTTNTIYLGYIQNDGTAHIAVSHDRGVNWVNDQNVGASFGIKNSTFPVVVAGDDNRAAFGFLGTTTVGDSSLDTNFPGIWHLYVATTYDAGNSWVTIDATPNDPVQVGPVCNAGTTCSTKRNLLDFNGFDIDAEGRGLVGIADGCVNCTNSSSSADSNASQATVFRQSGGPRLFHAFDPVEPGAPAAPQVISAVAESSPNGVLVSWMEPDNGGSPITAYNIYRGTTSGHETLLATVSNSPTNTHTKYLDTTATGTSNFYYHVTAVNSKGESTFCQEVSVVQAVGSGNACDFPYLTINGAGGNAPEATSQQQIQYVNIGEPFTSCTDNSLTFVMKVPTLDAGVVAGGPPTGQAVLPPNTEYQILWNVNDTNGNPKTIYVDVDTNCPGTPANPAFSYGRRDPGATGTFDSGVCTAQAPTSSCPQISGSFTADGTIIIKLDVSSPLPFAANTGASDPTEGAAFTWDGRAVGTQLKGVNSEITLFAGCLAGFLETLSSSSGGTYTRVGNISCSDLIPIAQLTTSPPPPNGNNGNAPLSVTFNASGSHEPSGACGTINSYTLDFGDGSAPVTQSSPNFSPHTYSNAGTYPARLTVKDTVGQVSNNAAEIVVTVSSPKPDLIVSALTASNNQAPQGSKVTLTATIKNQGNASAGASQTQFLLDGKTQIALVNTAGLAPGASVKVSTTWLTASVAKGTHTITATADKSNQVTESDETNNSKSITIQIQGNKT